MVKSIFFRHIATRLANDRSELYLPIDLFVLAHRVNVENRIGVGDGVGSFEEQGRNWWSLKLDLGNMVGVIDTDATDRAGERGVNGCEQLARCQQACSAYAKDLSLPFARSKIGPSTWRTGPTPTQPRTLWR